MVLLQRLLFYILELLLLPLFALIKRTVEFLLFNFGHMLDVAWQRVCGKVWVLQGLFCGQSLIRIQGQHTTQEVKCLLVDAGHMLLKKEP